MPAIADLTNQRFASLVVLEFAHRAPTTWKCQCDCGNVVNVQANHLKTGNTKSCGCRKLAKEPLADRLWRFVAKAAEDECWLWTGGTNGRYGVLGRGGRGAGMVYAHRVSYELERGPIPEGHDVMHACDTPLCVNPHHLSVGTRVDNMQDAARKGRTWKGGMPGVRNGRAKITEDDVRAIRASTEPTADLAKRYGIYTTMVSRIRAGKAWKSVA